MRSVVTPGNFDGVHRGHQALVARARARAEATGARTTALFFDPHPRAFFAPEAAAPLLTTPGRRVELLEGRGVDHVDVRPFDGAFAALSPEAFVDEVLVRGHDASAVVVGPDFRFGHRRAGDVETLRQLGRSRDFDVEVVAPVTLAGDVVSSTRVRACLGEGDVAQATELLGRVHDVTGEVCLGDQRGRTLGFPTANLDLRRGARGPGGLPPADGVYAVVARRVGPGGERWAGVANLGVRPTFDAGRSVEVHLFDFDGDLYGETLRVGFVARVRGERAFAGKDALVAQIRQDGRGARAAVQAAEAEAPETLAWI